ncbi:MAG: DUF433 domain-containing protein [Patescibacteria group bacterium]|nr:DUF433 domain-containing protein [Patescibacteria group bacterium]
MKNQNNNIISINKNIQGGQPVITGTRIPVQTICSLVEEQHIDPKIIITEYFTHISLDQVKKALQWDKCRRNYA